MKLDRKASKKNQFVDDLDLLDAKMNKIKLQNGVMYVGIAVFTVGVLDSLYNIISTAIQKGDINIAHMLLNFLIMAFGSVALERMFVKTSSNLDDIYELEKEYDLTLQSEQLQRILKKS